MTFVIEIQSMCLYPRALGYQLKSSITLKYSKKSKRALENEILIRVAFDTISLKWKYVAQIHIFVHVPWRGTQIFKG